MPQGQIRKGFFFYFGLFVLLLIAIFLICLVVMMFNPGKTVLWMKYFTGNEYFNVSQTTDENKTPINWSTVSNLEINCSYANVVVQKNKELPKDGIYIYNNAKGFSGASNAIKFDYNAYFEGNTLKIDVQEPNGFIFFSKDIRVVLNANVEGEFNFDKINLVVNTKDGQVDIGGTSAKGAETIKLSSLKVSTGKGDIYLTEKFDTSSLSSLSLSTEEGNINSQKTVSYDNGKFGKGLSVNCETELKTIKGNISFNVLKVVGHDLKLSCKKGNVAVDYIMANTVQVSCVQGNYKFGNVFANLSYTNSEDSIIAPNIIANYVSGDFVLTTTGNANADPDIKIGEVQGNIVVLADKGKLDIDKAHGAISVISANQLNVNIGVAEDKPANKTIDIKNVSGNVTVGFLGDVAGSVLLETNSGKIVVNFTTVANFTANSYLNDGQNTKLADNKINVNLGLSDGQTKNPLRVNGTSSVNGTLTVTTNSGVSFNVVDKTAI